MDNKTISSTSLAKSVNELYPRIEKLISMNSESKCLEICSTKSATLNFSKDLFSDHAKRIYLEKSLKLDKSELVLVSFTLESIKDLNKTIDFVKESGNLIFVFKTNKNIQHYEQIKEMLASKEIIILHSKNIGEGHRFFLCKRLPLLFKCKICNEVCHKTDLKDRGNSLYYYCAKCDALINESPPPDYDKSVYSFDANTINLDIDIEHYRKKVFPLVKDQLKVKKTGKVLDLGCGIPKFMKVLIDNGWNPGNLYGIDSNEIFSNDLTNRDVLEYKKIIKKLF
jgi:hypothetical protein